MRDVLCQLPFQADLLFFLSDVVDADLKAHILKMMHSTIKVFPFLLIVMDIRFSSLPTGRLGALLMKSVISLSSLILNTSSAVWV